MTNPRRRRRGSMRAGPEEFAYTLRALRPDYETTLEFVRRRIQELKGSQVLEHYQATLAILEANPDTFR